MNHQSLLKFHFGHRLSQSTNSAGSNDLLPPVSNSAIHFMQSILVERERRLSSPMYRFHDFKQNRLRHISSTLLRGHSVARHVYVNDAEEIKQHPWLANTPWNQLQHLRPPFVPNIGERQSVTKYFDDENNLDQDSSDSTLCSMNMSHENQIDASGDLSRSNLDAKVQNVEDVALHIPCDVLDQDDEAYCQKDFKDISLHVHGQSTSGAKFKVKRRNDKRPRDKLLRDPLYKKKVMDIRKRSAFLGYTYRKISHNQLWYDANNSDLIIGDLV